MPEYLAPGVFVEEIERGPRPIEGVATSTAAFLGETARGSAKPRLVTGNPDFERYFGGDFAPGKYMPSAVRAFFENGGRRCYIARIVGAIDGGDDGIASFSSDGNGGGYVVRALGVGEANNRIYVRISRGSTLRPDGNGGSEPIGFKLEAYYWDRVEPFDPTGDNALRTPRPQVSEVFDDLSLDPDSQDYYAKRVGNGNSALVAIDVTDGTGLITDTQVFRGALLGGSEPAAPGTADYVGDTPEVDQRRGLSALKLDSYREVALVYAPNVDDGVIQEIVTHCERNRFRFAVIDSKPNQGAADTLDPRTTLRDTQFGAFYYPWIKVADPRSGSRVTVPPGGAVCGLYAQTDNDRGVFKSPANVSVAGALDLEFDVDSGTQEVLNPRGVNCIRRFPGRGIRVWGARTLSSNSLWKYVSVRRLFIFLEASIYNATQWVVFEPNDDRLWARIKQTITLFLRTQWREGALLGEKEEEAFSVNVGRSTMTEDDILNGRLIVEVGIAPVRPAEFVIFRVFQKTREAAS